MGRTTGRAGDAGPPVWKRRRIAATGEVTEQPVLPPPPPAAPAPAAPAPAAPKPAAPAPAPPPPQGGAGAVRTRFGDPWKHSNAPWSILTVLMVVTAVGLVLLWVDLVGADRTARAWIVGVLVVGWAVFAVDLVRSVVLSDYSFEARRRWDVDGEMWRQSFAMAHFAMERGKTPRAADLEVLATYDLVTTDWTRADPARTAALAASHLTLSKLVAPAMPKTILLLSDFAYQQAGTDRDGGGAPTIHRQTAFSWLGNVRLARMMLGTAVFLLPVFVALALYKGTELDSAGGLFVGGFVSKAATAIYLIVASALGASFAALFKVRRYVESLTYDDQYESSYWMRFVLGLVAGLLLAVLLSPLVPGGDTAQFRITVPILALVGGFSSDLVYRVLTRMIDAIETLLDGRARESAEVERLRSALRLREMERDRPPDR